MGWRYKGGLVLILIVEIMWITSAEINQGVLTEYDHPFVVTYVGISLLTAYLPLAFIINWLKKYAKSKLCLPRNDIHDNAETEPTPTQSDIEQQRSVPKFSSKETAKLALLLAPIWFLSQYLSVAAITRTSVASATVLLSTSTLFTLWIAIFLGQESMNVVNIVSVIVSMAGVAMTAFGKTWTTKGSRSTTSMNGVHSLMGDSLALLSAITDALFTVLLKRYAGGGEKLDMPMLFGYIGIYTFGSLWCLVWPLTALHIEPKFEFPRTAEMRIVIANCFVGSFLCDYFWGLGIAWTTPLVAAIGSSLTIPFAMTEDMLIHGQHYSALYLVGSVLVVVGFVIANASKLFSTETSSKIFKSVKSLLGGANG